MREKRLFLFLFLFSVVLFVLDKGKMLAPLRGRIEEVVNPLRSRIYFLSKKPAQFWQILTVKKDVFEILKKKERELEACQLEIKNLKGENEDLRRLLQAPLPKNWAYLPAQVLGKNRNLLINKGEKDGVRLGMVVVFENFLVGKVTKVNQFSSLVTLPFDSQSKISVKTENGVRGLLEGRFGTRIFLTKVLQREKLEVGEMVLTTGEGDYPPNILIGKVKSKAKESQAPFKEVEIEPSLEYERLTTVFLVKE